MTANSRSAHPLDKLNEFQADCASGAWDPARGNFFEWFATAYPLARQMASVNGALKPEHFAPEMKRALPAYASKPADADHGWGEIVAKVNAERGRP